MKEQCIDIKHLCYSSLFLDILQILENDFVEPVYAFTPSIGISELINVDESFSNKWKKNGERVKDRHEIRM